MLSSQKKRKKRKKAKKKRKKEKKQKKKKTNKKLCQSRKFPFLVDTQQKNKKHFCLIIVVPFNCPNPCPFPSKSSLLALLPPPHFLRE
jgi:hypothetical protein